MGEKFFKLSSLSSLSSLSLIGIVVLIMMAIGMTGCVYDELPEKSVTGRPKDSFSVSIALAGMGTEETRAEGDPEEEAGTADENFIDINDLYVMTFSIPTGESTLTGDSELLEVIWNGQNGGKASDTGIYFTGNTAYLTTWLEPTSKQPQYGGNFCLVAVANCKEYNGGNAINVKNISKFSDLQDLLKYNFVQGNYIPLFGVKRVSLNGYRKEVNNVANPFILKSDGDPTLWMLRAFSKVEIKLSDDLLAMEASIDDISIESATINKYAKEFWVIPELNRMNGFSTSGGTGQVMAIPGEDYRSTSVQNPLTFSISEDKHSAILYLPEYELKSGELPEITLSLNLGMLNEQFKFQIKEYSSDNSGTDSAYWKSLQRNHYYMFEIGVDFKVISVKPQDWTSTYDNIFNFG